MEIVKKRNRQLSTKQGVAKGFLQRVGLDYKDVFVLVARIEMVRLVIAFAYYEGSLMFQLNVMSPFLNGPFKEEVYVMQAPSFAINDSEEKVYILKKLLVEIQSSIRGNAILEELKRFHMSNCNLATTQMKCEIKLTKDQDGNSMDNTLYKQIVDCLIYIFNSKPNIAYYVGLISKFMDNLKSSHQLATKGILRYLKETIDYGLLFPTASDNSEKKLIDCANSTGMVIWWTRRVVEELQVKMEYSIQLLVDNKSTINLTKNLVTYEKSKHIETQFYFLNDEVNKKKLEIDFFAN
ncbi:hypothetical protein CR513_61551, partial [Mucuna pruriens]